MSSNYKLSALIKSVGRAWPGSQEYLEQYLRAYINFQQDNWADLLPLAEYSMNDARSSTTKMSPFMACYGHQPTPPAFKGIQTTPAARDLSQQMKEVHQLLVKHASTAQEYQKKYYNRHHQLREFQKGDKVLLRTTNLRTERPSKKLEERKIGPFLILRRIGQQAYRLKMPPQSRVHPVFHVSLLERWNADTRHETPPPGIIRDKDSEEPEYEVETILKAERRRGRLRYLVKWISYGIDSQQEGVINQSLRSPGNER